MRIRLFCFPYVGEGASVLIANFLTGALEQKCCNFENPDGERSVRKRGGKVSGSQIEQRVDEVVRLANMSVAEPTRLPLANQYIASYPSTVRSAAWNLRSSCFISLVV